MAPSPWLYDCLKLALPFRPTAYRSHRRAPWVIGYGHVAGVAGGDTCTVTQAEQWLRADIAAAVSPATYADQGQLDVATALVVAGL